MKRVYHRYERWEDYKAGMWKSLYGEERKNMLKRAIDFTGNHKLYGEWMMKVIDNWGISCEHNFTCEALNKQAWVGHAACCMAIGCPEDITREAWGYLTKEQQDLANLEADKAILEWFTRQADKKGMSLDAQKIFGF